MDAIGNTSHLLNSLKIGISITSWCPEDTAQTEWIFANDARCRMTGITREELYSNPPTGQLTRESRAQFQKINEEIIEHGSFACESTLHHRSHKVIPVQMHMKLIRLDGKTVLLIEHHDISSFKETQSLLTLSRDSMREMLTLIEQERRKISENIKSNFGLVLFPLIDQLRITATGGQKDILDIMMNRIERLAREIGVVDRAGSFGLNLTRRQILVCEMIRDGMTSKEIAQALDCAPSTINNHRHAIRRKLKIAGKSTNLHAFLNSPPEERS